MRTEQDAPPGVFVTHGVYTRSAAWRAPSTCVSCVLVLLPGLGGCASVSCCRHGAYVVHGVVDDFLWGIANAGLPDPGLHPGTKKVCIIGRGGARRGGHTLIIYEDDSVQDHVTSVM